MIENIIDLSNIFCPAPTTPIKKPAHDQSTSPSFSGYAQTRCTETYTGVPEAKAGKYHT